MAIEIPKSAEFYIRTGLNRALEKTKEDIQNVQKAIDHPEIVEAIRDSLRGVLALQRQWYKEAVAEYREFPEIIRPAQDLLDWKEEK